MRLPKIECGIVMILVFILFSCNNSQDISDEDPAFVKAELEWRDARDQGMKTPSSWLTIAGLFWLEEGENTFGTDSGNDIRLPGQSALAFAGSFYRQGEKVKVISSEGTELKIEGTPITEKILKSDDSGKPDIVELHDLKMWVIKR